MHKLGRQVRFSINPFLPGDSSGYNSYVSNPAGEGLSIFFELCVELLGEIDAVTGFVVNVVDIDESVRQSVVPIFAERIREDFRGGKHIGFCTISELLELTWKRLTDKFDKARLRELSLKLNPFRKVWIGSEEAKEDYKMVYFSEKFEFAATHKLWNNSLSQQRNVEIFGKCANASGHGHNYIIEVTIKTQKDESDFCIGDFERTVDDELIKLVDHKNLNVDVAYFTDVIPTIENIAVFSWDRLVGKFDKAALHCVNIWETDKTYCSYYG